MVYLTIALVCSVVYSAYLYMKNRAAEALGINVKVKEDLVKIDEQKAKLQGLAEAEEAKRAEIIKNMQSQENKEVTSNELEEFFNKSNKPSSDK